MLNFELLANRDSIGALDTAQLLYLLLHIRPPEKQAKKRLPLNLCLVIDRSTSMKGERLNQVKAAANLVINTLSMQDVLSIITYSDRATVVVSAQRATQKPQLTAKVQSILPSGGTETYQGLSAGYSELRKTNFQEHINHLILLTDGHTYGDAEECLTLATKMAKKGIGLSAFGIGTAWNDLFLDALVAPSGGQSAYIESPNLVLDYLQNRIEGLGDLYAQNIQMEAQLPDGVTLKYALKLNPFAQPLQVELNRLKLGSIEGDSPLSVLMEFFIAPQSEGEQLQLKFNLKADIPSLNAFQSTFPLTELLNVESKSPEMQPDPELLAAVNVLNMTRMNDQIWADVEKGDLALATTRLRHLTQRFTEAGDPQLAQQAKMEIERLNRAGTLSEAGRKKLKFGTRSLLTQVLHK